MPDSPSARGGRGGEGNFVFGTLTVGKATFEVCSDGGLGDGIFGIFGVEITGATGIFGDNVVTFGVGGALIFGMFILLVLHRLDLVPRRRRP